MCGHPPPGDQPQNWRATGPRNGGHQPKNWTGADVLFNFVRLFCLCIAFEGDLSEVASAVGGTSLDGWFTAVVLLPHRSGVPPYVPSVGLVDVSTTTWGSTRQCANTARSTLPLSMVLVLACCLPDVTPSAPGKHEVDDFLGVHTTSCWCQAASGLLGADSACTGQPFPMSPQSQSMLAFREWTERVIIIIDALWPTQQVVALRFESEPNECGAIAHSRPHLSPRAFFLSLSSFVSPLRPLGLGLLGRCDPRSFIFFYDVTDAGPASHRVRLWRGGPVSTASTVLVIDGCVPCRVRFRAVFGWQSSPVTCQCYWVLFLLWVSSFLHIVMLLEALLVTSLASLSPSFVGLAPCGAPFWMVTSFGSFTQRSCQFCGRRVRTSFLLSVGDGSHCDAWRCGCER